jgi:hypothetical protein
MADQRHPTEKGLVAHAHMVPPLEPVVEGPRYTLWSREPPTYESSRKLVHSEKRDFHRVWGVE